MFIRKAKIYTENEIYPFVTNDDFNGDLIERVRKMALIRQPRHPWGEMTKEEIIKSAGMYKKDMNTGKNGFTLAAILLFGKDDTILSVLPHHKTDAILRVKNLDRYDDRDDIRTNLLDSYDRLMNFIAKHLNEIFYLEDGVRVNVRDKLFREVAANLLVHREYLSSFPAKLVIEDSCVWTENASVANGFGEIDIKTITPKPKNPTIARVFKEIGWAEELGSGVRNMAKYGKIYAKNKPILIEGDVFKTLIEIKASSLTDKMTDKMTDKNLMTDKTARVKAVFDYLKTNEYISNSDVRELLSVSDATAKRLLKAMSENAGLIAVGEGKIRRYKKAL